MDSTDHAGYEWDDETADHYARKYGEWATNRLPVEEIQLPSTSTIVDIGCGTGATLRRAADFVTKGVLIGIDPVQGRDTDLAEIKRKLGGKICLWGGINGFVTVEMGNKEEVESAVKTAISALAPGGGFILSPVDNIRETSQDVWENVQIMMDAWRRERVAIR